jgi:hypothetical protein
MILLVFQAARALAVVRHYLPEARGGEQRGHGVLDRHLVYDVVVRDYVYRVFPLEDEQGSWLHHVPAVLCIRCSVAHVRVRGDHVSGVNVIVKFVVIIERDQ